jgi:hypothetical protein
MTDEQVCEVQVLCDDFYQKWVDLQGREGITNYIHFLGAGHLAEYLFYWKNRYRHSQQGWEAFNSLLKTFYFRRTARGGLGIQAKDREQDWYL